MSNSKSPRVLPDGWVHCSIGEVTLPTTKIDPKSERDREVRYIDISSIDNLRNVVGDTKRFKLRDAPSRARQVVRSGDTLFATVRPYLRNIALVPSCYDREIASTGFSVLRPAEGICPEFLFYKAISSDFVDSVSGQQYGVSYPAVKDEQVRDQELWLPPTAEQYRIVAKIEELFSELDAGIESLKKERAKLATYKKAVLRYAFDGRLTAQWREDNRAILAPLDDLIRRINHERESRHERKLEEWQVLIENWEDSRSGRRPIRPRSLKSVSEVIDQDRAYPNALPSGWMWLTAESVVWSNSVDSALQGTGLRAILPSISELQTSPRTVLT